MQNKPKLDLVELKRQIGRFAVECASRSPELAECEFGELLLHLVRVAELQGVDLFRSADQALVARARLSEPEVRTGT